MNKISKIIFSLSILASSHLFAGIDCIQCMYYQNSMNINPYQNTGVMPVFSYMNPWWTGYSMNNYAFANRPAPWMNYGMNGQSYPGNHGGGMMGKPNVYVYGKEGERFVLEFNFSPKSQLLSAIPSFKKKWQGVIAGDGILHQNVFYRYYYYDYEVDINLLQWERGQCVKESDLMETLNEWLEKSGFNKREIDDFNEYWSYKMPQASEFCIYPQTQEELDKVAKIETTPKASINRLSFFIVPQTGVDVAKKVPSYKRPSKKWKPTKVSTNQALQINEWAVGWLDESQFQ